ncbi:hypothetical protein QN412_24085, partial [Pseudomonas sp. RTB3]|nr:hypothetical protein [Pseudomonas sp. RTB3]
MLSKVFKRKENPAPSMAAQDITDNRPTVGEVRKHGLEETLYLAPLPVCTGQAPVSMQNFSAMNDVYLQMGGSNNGMVFQGKLFAWAIWLTLIVLVFFPILMATLIIIFSPADIERSFWGLLWMGFQACLYVGMCMGVISVGTVGYTIVEGVRTQAKQYPLRFNRQRREVCFVDSDT